jgi:hypothetical protein
MTLGQGVLPLFTLSEPPGSLLWTPSIKTSPAGQCEPARVLVDEGTLLMTRARYDPAKFGELGTPKL